MSLLLKYLHSSDWTKKLVNSCLGVHVPKSVWAQPGVIILKWHLTALSKIGKTH